MRICYLGCGAWGLVLANIAAENGQDVVIWSIEQDVLESIGAGKGHPKFPSYHLSPRLSVEKDLEKALQDADMIVESVTTKGIRPVFSKIRQLGGVNCPIVLTSKGIEQDSGLLLPEIVLEVLGQDYKMQIGQLSGPTLADEVMAKHPTSAVAASYSKRVAEQIQTIFSTPYFRLYLSDDVQGVALGGSIKNVMAIASGIAEGLGYGHNTKSAIISRGLHEMKRLAAVKGAKEETLNGLAGLGDLCVTCMSSLSRNYRFGHMIGSGMEAKEAERQINMVVEGASTVISTKQLADRYQLDMPITHAVYAVLVEGTDPKEAVRRLLTRERKEELV
jgi:glycerol-3-phosphate dehydrogenase (NAD(P)+)